MEPVRSIFAHWPQVDFQEIDSGCCGMAGSFGYEAKHYDISKKMAERVLIPAIEDHPDAMIIANGFSCRHQIHDFANRNAVHIAEAFERILPPAPIRHFDFRSVHRSAQDKSNSQD